MRILKIAWTVFSRAILYILLLAIIMVASILLFSQKMAEGIGRNPKFLMGTNPMGASAIVKWWTKGMIWPIKKSRKWLGEYVRSHHPQVYGKTQRLFR